VEVHTVMDIVLLHQAHQNQFLILPFQLDQPQLDINKMKRMVLHGMLQLKEQEVMLLISTVKILELMNTQLLQL